MFRPFQIGAIIGASVLLGSSSAEARPTCDGKPATVVGSSGRDVIKAPQGGNQVIVARGGNDVVKARPGRDVVCGGPGKDILRGGPTKDLLIGGTGRDTLDGGGGSDGMKGGGGADLLLAGPGQDVVRGGPRRDRIYGGYQDDFLFGQPGNDVLVGNQGVDLLRGDRGNDLLRGDENTDTYLGGGGSDWVSFAAATPGVGGKGEGVEVLFASGRIYGDGGSEDIRDVENVVGSAFSDRFAGTMTTAASGAARGIAGTDSCFPFARTDCGPYPFPETQVALVDQSSADAGILVVGGPGADRWQIQPRGDTRIRIEGPNLPVAGPGCQASAGAITCSASSSYLGHLTIYGDEGADRISITGRFREVTSIKVDGGPGSDELTGGSSDESLYGGQDGRDTLTGQGGDDVLFAGEGSDTLRGGSGEDQLAMDIACQGHDYSGGSGGPDIVTFALAGGISAQIGGKARYRRGGSCTADRINADVEILEGSSSQDTLRGNNRGNGLILGLGGDDFLEGLGGRDRLRGGSGNDVMLGGPGPDILQARDGTRDVRIDCGPGGRQASVDAKDPKAQRC